MLTSKDVIERRRAVANAVANQRLEGLEPDSRTCLLYTSPSPRDVEESRMPSSA